MRGDRRISRDGFLALTGDEFQCADEAGRVAGSKQLLGVGCFAACAAQLFWGCQFDVEDFIAGNSAAITATGCGCDCSVESLHGCTSEVFEQIAAQCDQVFLQRLELLEIDAAGRQNAVGDALSFCVQRFTLRGQRQQDDALVFLAARPADQALGLQPFEQRRQRARVSQQASADFSHGHSVALPQNQHRQGETQLIVEQQCVATASASLGMDERIGSDCRCIAVPAAGRCHGHIGRVVRHWRRAGGHPGAGGAVRARSAIGARHGAVDGIAQRAVGIVALQPAQPGVGASCADAHRAEFYDVLADVTLGCSGRSATHAPGVRGLSGRADPVQPDPDVLAQRHCRRRAAPCPMAVVVGAGLGRHRRLVRRWRRDGHSVGHGGAGQYQLGSGSGAQLAGAGIAVVVLRLSGDLRDHAVLQALTGPARCSPKATAAARGFRPELPGPRLALVYATRYSRPDASSALIAHCRQKQSVLNIANGIGVCSCQGPGVAAVAKKIRNAPPLAPADRPGQSAAESPRVKYLAVQFKDPSRVTQQHLAFRGKADGAAVFDKQGPPHYVLFQPLHLHADCRLRAVNHLASLGVAAFVCDGDEGAQQFAVDARGRMMKSQKGYVLVVKPVSRQFAPERWWKAAVEQIARWWKLHRERVELATLSDDALKDMGLSRADVYEEMERPFWDDPMKR
nr:hypothetical protein [Tanacetum cinerariifolium]